MTELHLKQPRFTYSACGPFTKHCERIKKFREKACFAHDAAYPDSKDLAKRTISVKILKDRAYEIVRNRWYDGYQKALASMVCKVFNKKSGWGMSVNEQLAEELHKPVTKYSKRRKFYVRFKDNVWVADLAEMKSLSSKYKNIKYLLCVIDIFTKYAWVKPLKDKSGKTVLNTFIEIEHDPNPKPSKFWFGQWK